MCTSPCGGGRGSVYHIGADSTFHWNMDIPFIALHLQVMSLHCLSFTYGLSMLGKGI